MGFYLRKTIKVGPLRFNLSKSGIGVSAGVTGLRLGTGPRGNYVHMGRKGLHYRSTLPPLAPSQTRPRAENAAHPRRSPDTYEALKEIESVNVFQIVHSSSRELLDELNAKQKKLQLMPLVAACFGMLLFIGLYSDWPSWLQISILLLGAAGTYLAYNRDLMVKTVVLFYGFDQDLAKAYNLLHHRAERLASCKEAWHVESNGRVREKKYHAGASNILSRKPTRIRKGQPPNVKTNIETISIGVGRQTLHFFPDRVLVYDRNGVGGVGYNELKVEITQSQFIEEGPIPRDAQVVGHTWQYANKSGGPDKRFKDNRRLPICLYDEISFTSRRGLNEVIQVSQAGIADDFRKIIDFLGSKMPRERR